jgi:glycosyltransferase involved in cell wall biosynthesis
MFLNFTDSLGYANADLLTLVSNYDEEYAILKRYREKKSIITIENPLRQEFLKQRFVERQKFVMGYVGSWTDRKGCQQLIKTINLLNINGYKGEWLIIGIGAAGKKEILNNTALTFDQVIENVSRNELISYYNQMSMLIVLSCYESFGMVSSEAMSCGALLVSTNVGFANSLIDGKNYIKIDRNKCAENASLIIDIQQHWESYKHIAMEGQQRVQTLEWQKAADTLEEVYSRHLNI